VSAAEPPQGASPSGEAARSDASGDSASAPRTVTLAFTGASGMPFGLRLLECLVAAQSRVFLLYSSAAQVVAKQECALTLPTQPREAARLFSERYRAAPGQIQAFAREDWNAPVASGPIPQMRWRSARAAWARSARSHAGSRTT
jgi:hypothetical protein